MRLDESTIYAFLLVFIRCSAMMLSAPVFSGSTIPTQVRVFSCMAVAGSLTAVLQPRVGPLPTSLAGLAISAGGEAIAGVLIGSLMNLVMQAAQIAGSLIDLQIGLGLSQVLNPISGTSVTVVAQFKSMLAVVIFLTANAHHFMIQALVESYRQGGVNPLTLLGVEHGIVVLLGAMSMLALQIAAPVMAVSLVVDAALGLISKAVPQMQALPVGIPAKLAAGMIALAFSLPPLVAGVTNGCGMVAGVIHHMFAG